MGIQRAVARVLSGVGVVIAASALGLTGSAHASLHPESAPEPLSCEQLVTPELEALATQFDRELLPVAGDDLYIPAPDRDRFLSLGGQYCAWHTSGIMHAAYSPLSPAEAQSEMARLEAAGLERSESAAGTSFQLGPVDWFTVPETSGHYLFADGYWYLVKDTTSGSGGTTLMPTDLSVLAAFRSVVESTLGPSASLIDDEQLPPDEPGPADAPLSPSERADSFTASDPSVLSTLPVVADIVQPQHLATAAGAGLVFTALVALPTALLNHSLQEGYARLRARIRRALVRGRGASRPRRQVAPGVVIMIGLVAATLISVFIDPRVGFNGGTLRLFASTLAGLTIESLALLSIVAWIMRRRGASAHTQFQIGSLVILALAVLATRLTGFEPGFLFGVVIAIVFARPPDDEQERAASRIELGLLVALALIAWCGYSLLFPLAVSHDDIALFGTEMLASMTVGGLTGLMILLIPVGATPGAVLFRANRLRWGIAFFAAVAVFCAVVLPLPESWQAVDAPFVLWFGLFAAYAALAIVVWAVVTFVRPHPELEEPRPDEARTHASN